MSGRLAAGMCLLLCPYATVLHAQVPVPRPEMEILVLEGAGAAYNVRHRQGRDIVVQVRDGNRQSLAGATVVFTLPERGAGGEFAGGSKLATVVADSEGRAIARIYRPNAVPGKWEIVVKASHEGQSARAVITQFNMVVERAGSGGKKWLAVVAVAGAAAAGGAVALSRRNGSSGTAAPPPVSISITPTTGTIGPPR